MVFHLLAAPTAVWGASIVAWALSALSSIGMTGRPIGGWFNGGMLVVVWECLGVFLGLLAAFLGGGAPSLKTPTGAPLGCSRGPDRSIPHTTCSPRSIGPTPRGRLRYEWVGLPLCWDGSNALIYGVWPSPKIQGRARAASLSISTHAKNRTK